MLTLCLLLSDKTEPTCIHSHGWILNVSKHRLFHWSIRRGTAMCPWYKLVQVGKAKKISCSVPAWKSVGVLLIHQRSPSPLAPTPSLSCEGPESVSSDYEGQAWSVSLPRSREERNWAEVGGWHLNHCLVVGLFSLHFSLKRKKKHFWLFLLALWGIFRNDTTPFISSVYAQPKTEREQTPQWTRRICLWSFSEIISKWEHQAKISRFRMNFGQRS